MKDDKISLDKALNTKDKSFLFRSSAKTPRTYLPEGESDPSKPSDDADSLRSATQSPILSPMRDDQSPTSPNSSAKSKLPPKSHAEAISRPLTQPQLINFKPSLA